LRGVPVRTDRDVPLLIENQAAHNQGWLEQLKADKKLVIGAATAAQKDADGIDNRSRSSCGDAAGQRKRDLVRVSDLKKVSEYYLIAVG
jgi:hypothetical protein